MGIQAKTRKDRVCDACQGHIFGTAKDLKSHASDCKRLQALGLVFPSIIAAGGRKVG